MKILILILLVCQFIFAQEDKCGNFKTKHQILKLNTGLRINNFVFFSFTFREKESRRPLYYKQFFQVCNKREGILFCHRVKIGDQTYFHHPKDWLLCFYKNRGHIQTGALAIMDGVITPIPDNAHHICEFMTILWEFIFLPTNHNFFKDL